jgi:hypothetical protein
MGIILHVVNKKPTRSFVSRYISLFSPWSIDLLELLTGSLVVKKLFASYGIWRFNTACIRAHHLSLSRPTLFSPCPHIPLPEKRSILMSSLHQWLGLPSGFFPSIPTKSLYIVILSPKLDTWPVHLILLNIITRTISGEQYGSLRSCSFLHSRYRPKHDTTHSLSNFALFTNISKF